MKETMRPKARRNSDWNGLIVFLDDVSEAVTHKSNTAHAKEIIHDNLEAYYKVAYKRFVDNVFSQAVNYKLLSGPENPLQLFSEQWVLRLDATKLRGIAGESRRTREHRERLKKEIECHTLSQIVVTAVCQIRQTIVNIADLLQICYRPVTAINGIHTIISFICHFQQL